MPHVCLALQMQFVRDSDVGAIIAGAGSRPAEELVTALRKAREQMEQLHDTIGAFTRQHSM